MSLDRKRSDSAASAASCGRLVRPERSSRATSGSLCAECLDERTVLGRPDGHQAGPAHLDGPPGDLGEVLGGPALRQPAGPEVQDQCRAGDLGQGPASPLSIGLADRHDEPRLRDRGPQASATCKSRSTAWVSGPGEGMRWV